MSFSLMIEHTKYHASHWGCSGENGSKEGPASKESFFSADGQLLNHLLLRCCKSMQRGHSVQPSKIRTAWVDFGIFIEISEAKSNSERKFGKRGGEARVQRPWGRKGCGHVSWTERWSVQLRSEERGKEWHEMRPTHRTVFHVYISEMYPI